MMSTGMAEISVQGLQHAVESILNSTLPET